MSYLQKPLRPALKGAQASARMIQQAAAIKAATRRFRRDARSNLPQGCRWRGDVQV